MNDMSHARNALSRVSQNGTAELKAAVRAKVHKKFPGIGEQKACGGTVKRSGGKVDGHDKKAPAG